MKKNNVKIWIWLHNGKIMKAISYPDEGTLTIYDDHDNILLKRTGLSLIQMKKIEIALSSLGAKQLTKNKEPFTYL